MEDQMEEKIKSERSEVIRLIAEENRIHYMKSMLGKEQRILIEKVDRNGMAHGYGEHYLPVNFPTVDHTKNRFQQVILNQVKASESPTILGSPISP